MSCEILQSVETGTVSVCLLLVQSAVIMVEQLAVSTTRKSHIAGNSASLLCKVCQAQQ